MPFPSLVIDKLKAVKPIIQGGMAIRISRASLAAAVANCGGVGVIAASGLAQQELRDQIREARSNITNPGGLLAINIMFAASEFEMIVNTAIEEKIDLVIFGAGFSRDIFAVGKQAGVPIVPIVSSVKLAKISAKLGASAIIVESGEAGGHLGTCRPIRELIPEVKQALSESESSGNIPIIAAGGVTSGADILEMLSLGANGVQMATRFLMSKECDVHDNFKQLLLNAGEKDIVLIESPVGLPGRAVLSPLTQKLLAGNPPAPKECQQCLKHCSRSFCIIKALEAARKGDVENGLFFTGANLKKYQKIISVKEIFETLERQAKESLAALQR
jgi:NAD(P)H-dependent flavin oxidoreductase YrpB (nitropropane dioxygenase family)